MKLLIQSFVFNVNELTWSLNSDVNQEHITLPHFCLLVELIALCKQEGALKKDNVLENVPNTGISYHSSLNVGPCNFIVGGNSDESLNGTHNIHTVKTSTKRPEIHVCVTYFPFDFSVAQYSQMEVK